MSSNLTPYAWLAAILRGEQPAWPKNETSDFMDRVWTTAEENGVLALCQDQLVNSPSWASLPTTLLNFQFVDFQPRWSPDGSQLSFASNREGNPEVYRMDMDGGRQTRLTNSVGTDASADWIP